MANFFEKGISDMSLEELDLELKGIQTERAAKQEVKRKETKIKRKTVSFATLFPDIKDEEARKKLFAIAEIAEKMAEREKKGENITQEDYLVENERRKERELSRQIEDKEDKEEKEIT